MLTEIQLYNKRKHKRILRRHSGVYNLPVVAKPVKREKPVPVVPQKVAEVKRPVAGFFRRIFNRKV